MRVYSRHFRTKEGFLQSFAKVFSILTIFQYLKEKRAYTLVGYSRFYVSFWETKVPD